jgi:hypothetical protein
MSPKRRKTSKFNLEGLASQEPFNLDFRVVRRPAQAQETFEDELEALGLKHVHGGDFEMPDDARAFQGEKPTLDRKKPPRLYPPTINSEISMIVRNCMEKNGVGDSWERTLFCADNSDELNTFWSRMLDMRRRMWLGSSVENPALYQYLAQLDQLPIPDIRKTWYFTLELLNNEKGIAILENGINNYPVRFLILDYDKCIRYFNIFFVTLVDPSLYAINPPQAVLHSLCANWGSPKALNWALNIRSSGGIPLNNLALKYNFRGDAEFIIPFPDSFQNGMVFSSLDYMDQENIKITILQPRPIPSSGIPHPVPCILEHNPNILNPPCFSNRHQDDNYLPTVLINWPDKVEKIQIRSSRPRPFSVPTSYTSPWPVPHVNPMNVIQARDDEAELMKALEDWEVTFTEKDFEEV